MSILILATSIYELKSPKLTPAPSLVPATALHVAEDPLFRHERQCENLLAQRRHTLVGILGFGKVPKKVTELVVKKRRGQELSWEDTEYFIKGLETGHVSKEQAGQ
jgi:hypothetical protein